MHGVGSGVLRTIGRNRPLRHFRADETCLPAAELAILRLLLAVSARHAKDELLSDGMGKG